LRTSKVFDERGGGDYAELVDAVACGSAATLGEFAVCGDDENVSA